MRIVHFSDWHGETFALPPADLYVCTGDMLPNFRICVIETEGGGTLEWEDNMDLLGASEVVQPAGAFVKNPPIHAREVELQTRYLDRMGHGYMRERLASKNALVVCCRGNHEFVDLAPMFAGGPVVEISEDPTTTLLFGPLKIGGVRGVKRHRNEWSDELADGEFSDLAARLPRDLDVLVTHSPPEGILDQMPGVHVGSSALRSYVARHDPALSPLKAHLFGHIHESRGLHALGGTIFSNASQGWQIVEFDL